MYQSNHEWLIEFFIFLNDPISLKQGGHIQLLMLSYEFQKNITFNNSTSEFR